MRKALVSLGSQTLVERAVSAFKDVAGITGRVVVLHPEDLAKSKETGLLERLKALSVRAVVAGGATRQESVLAGVRATNPSVRDVLVHDAARPFVRQERIEDLLFVLKDSQAAL